MVESFIRPVTFHVTPYRLMSRNYRTKIFVIYGAAFIGPPPLF
jgi:hypothetical protein